MAGNHQMLRHLICLIALTFIFVSCSENEEVDNDRQDLSEKVLLSCSDDFLAASFHLMPSADLFSDRTLFIGQPAYYFNELVDAEEFETILDRFHKTFNAFTDSQKIRLAEQFHKWCTANEVLGKASQSLSVEELFNRLATDSKIYPFFKKALGDRSNLIENDSHPDLFSSLSSAEIHFYRQNFLTELSTVSDELFRDILHRIERFNQL